MSPLQLFLDVTGKPIPPAKLNPGYGLVYETYARHLEYLEYSLATVYIPNHTPGKAWL